MALDYISDRIGRDQFLEKVYQTSQSQSTRESAHAHLTNLDLYCKDKYDRDTDTVLDDLRTDMEITRSPAKVLRFLDDFVSWLQVDHPHILLTKARHNSAKYYLRKKNKNSISHYFSTSRKYLSLVGGIRIHDDDIKMAITKPKADTGNYEDEESEPLTAEQARAIIELTTDQQSITLYHFLNDVGFRMTETCLVQEKHINFEIKHNGEVLVDQIGTTNIDGHYRHPRILIDDKIYGINGLNFSPVFSDRDVDLGIWYSGTLEEFKKNLFEDGNPNRANLIYFELNEKDIENLKPIKDAIDKLFTSDAKIHKSLDV